MKLKTAIILLALTQTTNAARDNIKTVEIIIAAPRMIEETIAVPGTVHTRNEVQLTAGVNGRLLMVHEPGTVIKQGEAVARIDDSTLQLQKREQQALLKRARVELRRQQLEFDRLKKLSDSNAVSEFQLDNVRALRDLARTEQDIIKVRIEQIEEQISRTYSTADFNGVVTERMHRSGEDVSRGQILARLTDTDTLEVRAFVPLKHLENSKQDVVLDVYVNNHRQQGKIRTLIPAGDIRSQTFEARIDLSDNDNQIWSVGQLVSVAIPINNRTERLAVPRDALILRNDGIYIFVVENEMARRITVSLGDSDQNWIAVTGKLNAGDRVVTRGAETLNDGDSVRVINPA